MPRSKKEKTESGSAEEEVNPAFPDLHHKMSKKIAQLTKVIYHLNTKNEDNQSMVESLKMQHQFEIEQLVVDVGARMANTKEMGEIKKQLATQTARSESMQKKHAAEKQKTLADFEKYKEVVSTREDKIVNDWQLKCDSMSEDIEKMNSNFMEKMESFSGAKRKMQAKLETLASTGGAAAEELKKSHDDEIEQLVREANEKYQDMLMDQLKQREDLQKECDLKIEQIRKEAGDEAKAMLEMELGKLRAQLGAEAQESLMKLRRELETKLQEQRDDLIGKLEKCLLELKTKSSDYQTLNQEFDKKKEEFEGLTQKHNTELQNLEHTMQNLNIEIASRKQQLSEAEAKIKLQDEIIMNGEKLIVDKNDIIRQLQDSKAQMEQLISSLQAELLNSAKSGESTQDEMNQMLREKERDLLDLKKEINQLQEANQKLVKELQASKDELKILGTSSNKQEGKLKEMLDSETNAKNAFKTKLDEALSKSASEIGGLQAELKILRKQVEEKSAEIVLLKDNLGDSHTKEIAQMQDKHKKEIDAMKSLNDALFDKNNEILKDIEVQKVENKKAIDNLKQESANKVEELKNVHKEEIQALKIIVAQLEGQLANLMENADGEKQRLEKDYHKSLEKCKYLKNELEAKKKEGEGAQGVISGLKSQIENLREELKANQKAFRDKMDMGLQKLEEDWQQKMDQVKELHNQEILDIRIEMDGKMSSDKEDLIKSHEALMIEMTKAFEDQKTKAAEAYAISENERIKLEIMLGDEIKKGQEEVEMLLSKHKNDLETLKAEMEAKMSDQNLNALQSSDIMAKQLMEKHASEISALNAKSLEDKKLASEEKDKAIQSTMVKAKAHEDSALAELQSLLDAQSKSAILEMQEKHAAELQTLIDKNTASTESMTSDLESLKSNVTKLESGNTDLETRLKEEIGARKKENIQSKMAIEQLTRDNDLNLRKEKENSERQMLSQQERLDADMRLMKQEFTEDRQRFDEYIDEAKKEYQILEERYLNRDSREDDVLRIQQLEQDLIDKDERVKTMKDELEYFKRELMNREESYNQKFNAKPNVGVMQVIKDPASSSTKSNAPGGGSQKSQKAGMMSSKSNKPTRVVGGGGMGMGGMDGIGGGGMGMGVAPGLPGSQRGPPIPGSSREGRR